MRLRTIEHKLFLLILPLCLVPPVLLLLLFGVGSRLTFQQTVGSELSSRAEYLAGTFDQFLSVRIARLRELAAAGKPLQLNTLATSASLAAGTAGVVCVRDTRTTETEAVLADPAAKYDRWLAEAPYFKPFTQSRLSVAPEGCFQDLELSIPARVAPLPLFMFVIETPARERLFFIFEASSLVKAFRQSLPQHPENFYIYSSSGFVPYAFETADPLLALHIRDQMNQPHKDQRWFAMDDNNEPYLVAPAASKYMTHARTLSGQGVIWSVLLTYDMENFLSPLESYIWLSVLIALILALTTLLLGLFAARNIARPLVNLKHQAEEIALGHLDVRAEVQSQDEVGELAEAFNTMAARLRDTYQALEERLEDNLMRANHINVINEITAAIVQTLSLDRIFEVLTREMGKLARTDAIWIALMDKEKRELRITHIHPGRLMPHFEGERIPLSGSIHGHAALSQETIHAEIGHQDRGEFFETRILKSEGFQSYLIAPLPSGDRIIGTLTVAATAPDALGGDLASVIGSLAGAVAIAIEQAELFSRISCFASELEQKVESRTRELERVNRHLLQTEKYVATGRLAGNLAHEINNPLGIIKNYLRLVENDLKRAAADGRETGIKLNHVQVLNEEVERIARLVRQMLNLHRPEEQIVKPIDFNTQVSEVLSLMEQDLKHQCIEVIRDLAPGLPRPVASPDLVRQLLINLLRNAQDAMEGGGTLTVRTSALTQWAGETAQHFVRLQITDTGCGIPPEYLSRIFDPFFTTKPPEKGTGLGLCISYSIVSMYQGTLDVESKVGRGTTILVTIPLATAEKAAPRLPAQAAGGDSSHD